MNIESSNLYNILSAIIINQSLLKSQINNASKEIFYIDNFNEEHIISGLYIDKRGETRFWNGTDWEYVSQEVISGITMQATHETIPTSKAVYDLVDSRTSGSVSDGVITDINLTINSISNDVGIISSKLNEVIDDVEDLKENGGKAELFYVNNFDMYPEDNPPSISGLYIDHDGETRFWNGTEWEYTSKNVVSIIDNSTINLDVETVPTAKAVHDFVKNQIENIEFPETGKPEVFYVSTFENFNEDNKPSISGLYIDHDGETRFWNGTEWEYTSHKIDDEITNNPSSETIPTSKAVYDFVENQIKNIKFPEDEKPEVFYVESFPSNPEISGFYIDYNGQTKFWNGTDWEQTSYELLNEINSTDENKVPSVKAVYDYVSNITSDFISSSSLDQINSSINTMSDDLTDVSGNVNQLSDNIVTISNDVDELKRSISNNSGKPEVFYVESLPSNPEISGFYIDHNGQTKFWNGTEWEQTSYEIIDEIKLENDELIDKEKITSVKAVYDFVKSEIENIEFPEGEKPEVFYISSFVNYTPTVSGLYIDYDGETRFWDGSNWEQTSHEIIDEITNDIEKKEDKIPSVKAVYDYVNEKTSGTTSDSRIDELNLSINSLTGNLNNLDDTVKNLSSDVESLINDVNDINEEISSISSDIEELKSNTNNGGGKDEIFYVSSFPGDDETPAAGLYIIETGESRYYTGEKWEKTSYEVIDEVLPNEENKVPTSKAIYDFVNNKVGESGGNNTSDSGKPEVFYIPTFEGYTPTVSGFHIDHDGETRFWNGTEWEQTSHEIIDEINELTIAEITVPTSNAVCKFVKEELSKFESTEETGSGKPEVFYVDSFVSNPEVSGLYINHKGESSFYTGSEWKKITVETINEVNSTESTKIPTSKAIYDFVKFEIENIEIPEAGKPEVFYVPTFENFTPETSGLYIDHDGETRFWNNTEWEIISHEIANEISDETSENIAVSVKAVRNFVQSEINKMDFTGDTNSDSGKPEVFYVPTFENFTPETSGLYIDHDGETRFWNNTEWEYTSKEVIDDITENDLELISDYIPSVGAVYNFINDKLENIQNTGSGKDEIFHIESFINYVPDVIGLYIDNEGQSKYWNGDDWEIISREIVNEISSESLSSTIPSTKAVYDLVNSMKSGFHSIVDYGAVRHTPISKSTLDNAYNDSGLKSIFDKNRKALQDAINAAAQTSGIVFIPEGEFVIGEGTGSYSINVPSNVHITGSGSNSILRFDVYSKTQNGSFLQLNRNTKNVRISNLTLRGGLFSDEYYIYKEYLIKNRKGTTELNTQDESWELTTDVDCSEELVNILNSGDEQNSNSKINTKNFINKCLRVPSEPWRTIVDTGKYDKDGNKIYEYPGWLGYDKYYAIHCIGGENIADFTMENVNIESCRYMGVTFAECRNIKITNCSLSHILRDGIHLKNCKNSIIANNNFYRVLDDVIAIHSMDVTLWPEIPRDLTSTRQIISNNIIDSCQGIKCLGGKNIIIEGNILTRSQIHAIHIGLIYEAAGEGKANVFNINISNNIILDTIRGASNYLRTFTEWNSPQFNSSIQITSSPIGPITDKDGTVINLMDEYPVDKYYCETSGNCSFGAHNIIISDNQIGYTLNYQKQSKDGTRRWSDYSKDLYFSLHYEGTKFAGSELENQYQQIKFIDPILDGYIDNEHSPFNASAMAFLDSFNNLQICNNIIYGGGKTGINGEPAILFRGIKDKNLVLKNVKLNDNIITNWIREGAHTTDNGNEIVHDIGVVQFDYSVLRLGASSTDSFPFATGNVEIKNNNFDLDPYKITTGRLSGGGFLKVPEDITGEYAPLSTYLSGWFGISFRNYSGFADIENNTFQNTYSPIYYGDYYGSGYVWNPQWNAPYNGGSIDNNIIIGGTDETGTVGVHEYNPKIGTNWKNVKLNTCTSTSGYVIESHASKFVYFDIPDESQINSENGTLLLIEIDFSNDDDFSEKISFSLSDCQVFNPTTGNWIECPADGLDITVANSKIRINKYPENYLNCRYRWKTTNGYIGSYKTVII